MLRSRILYTALNICVLVGLTGCSTTSSTQSESDFNDSNITYFALMRQNSDLFDSKTSTRVRLIDSSGNSQVVNEFGPIYGNQSVRFQDGFLTASSSELVTVNNHGEILDQKEIPTQSFLLDIKSSKSHNNAAVVFHEGSGPLGAGQAIFFQSGSTLTRASSQYFTLALTVCNNDRLFWVDQNKEHVYAKSLQPDGSTQEFELPIKPFEIVDGIFNCDGESLHLFRQVENGTEVLIFSDPFTNPKLNQTVQKENLLPLEVARGSKIVDDSLFTIGTDGSYQFVSSTPDTPTRNGTFAIEDGVVISATVDDSLITIDYITPSDGNTNLATFHLEDTTSPLHKVKIRNSAFKQKGEIQRDFNGARAIGSAFYLGK